MHLLKYSLKSEILHYKKQKHEKEKDHYEAI